jgi:hypothetical protein
MTTLDDEARYISDIVAEHLGFFGILQVNAKLAKFEDIDDIAMYCARLSIVDLLNLSTKLRIVDDLTRVRKLFDLAPKREAAMKLALAMMARAFEFKLAREVRNAIDAIKWRSPPDSRKAAASLPASRAAKFMDVTPAECVSFVKAMSHGDTEPTEPPEPIDDWMFMFNAYVETIRGVVFNKPDEAEPEPEAKRPRYVPLMWPPRGDVYAQDSDNDA